MTSELNEMNLSGLVDLLVQEMQNFTQLMHEKRFTKEYEECRSKILALQDAILLKTGSTVDAKLP